jgi:ppGpp synthetase/RelA/SpoT-type nucleotidyltranferase
MHNIALVWDGSYLAAPQLSLDKEVDDKTRKIMEHKKVSLSILREDYEKTVPQADKFRIELKSQIEQILSDNALTLGASIESRTKKWDSIVEKIDRRTLKIESITELNDLVGIRLIFLFYRDAIKACKLIKEHFRLRHEENISTRLNEAEFGYGSFHYVISINEAWMSVPTLRNFKNLQAEIQVRTLAQHNWAAASHVLQYKHEKDVPTSIRRSIHRVAALLEVVDLEFERVLDERSKYIKEISEEEETTPLNADLLKRILDKNLPEKHRLEEDAYSDLVKELYSCGIGFSPKLLELIEKQLENTISREKNIIEEIRSGATVYEINDARMKKGVFYSHVGLVRNMLDAEFGPEWRNKAIL